MCCARWMKTTIIVWEWFVLSLVFYKIGAKAPPQSAVPTKRVRWLQSANIILEKLSRSPIYLTLVKSLFWNFPGWVTCFLTLYRSPIPLGFAPQERSEEPVPKALLVLDKELTRPRNFPTSETGKPRNSLTSAKKLAYLETEADDKFKRAS